MKKIFLLVTAGLACLLSSCESGESVGPGASDGAITGKGGSMARFAVVGDYLYTVDNASLNLFDISNAADPQPERTVPVTFGVETIFPFGDKLFIGTQTGMQIYDISNQAAPQYVSHYEHVVACDPVVTDGRYAYVTLRSGTACRQAINQLQVIDLQDIKKPTLIQQYNMKNPMGLGIDNDLLFVCDDGLKVYDATDAMALQLIYHFDVKAYDVIPVDGRLLLIGSDGFYQYQYDAENLTLLSKIDIRPKF